MRIGENLERTEAHGELVSEIFFLNAKSVPLSNKSLQPICVGAFEHFIS